MVALIATNGLFVAAEFGLTTVDRSKLRRLAASGDQRAGGVLAAVQELSLQLSGAQLGITLTSLLLGLVAEPVLARLLDVPLQALGLPDAVADAGAVVLAPLLRGFTRLCRPVIALCNDTANAIVRGLGAEPQEELRSARTPAELDSLIGASAEEGTLNPEIAALLRCSLTRARPSCWTWPAARATRGSRSTTAGWTRWSGWSTSSMPSRCRWGRGRGRGSLRSWSSRSASPSRCTATTSSPGCAAAGSSWPWWLTSTAARRGW